jgi:hypothetical protein
LVAVNQSPKESHDAKTQTLPPSSEVGTDAPQQSTISHFPHFEPYRTELAFD